MGKRHWPKPGTTNPDLFLLAIVMEQIDSFRNA